MTARRLVVAAALAALCASTASAQSDAPRARELFQRGVTLMENQDWGAALVQLQESFRLRPTQVALFNMGLCLKGLRRYREAIETFERLISEFADRGTEARVALARTELENLRALFGTIRIEVRPDGAQVFVDGEHVGTSPLAAPVASTGGTHVVEARLEGHDSVQREVAVVVGTTATVEIQLAPSAEPPAVTAPAAAPVPPPPRLALPPDRARPSQPPRDGVRPVWFWSAVAFGGAAAVTTGVLGALVVVGDADYRDSRVRLASEREAGQRLALLTDVALGLSLASAVAAVLLYGNTRFGSDSTDRAVRPVLLASPDDLGFALAGTFP